MDFQATDTSVTLQPVICELGQLSRPDGSATFCLGNTMIVAAVYGPGEARIQKELATEANVEVIYKPKSGMPSCLEKFQEHLVKNTCKSIVLTAQYPRTLVTIVLQEVQNAGSLLAGCINAACLALIDSGIALKCLVAGMSCAVDNSGVVTLDPTSEQEKEAKATMVFVFDSRDNSLLTSHSEGTFSEKEYHKCLIMCRDASKNVFKFYRDTVARKFSKDS